MIKLLKNLESGQLFTLKPISYPSDNQVYVRDYYDRSSKKYFCFKYSDISSGRLLKGDTKVYVDFIF